MAVETGISLLQKLTGSYVLSNLTASILTSVKTKMSARKSPLVLILVEALSVSVIEVSKEIFAKTSMSVAKRVLVMKMHHV